MTEDDVLQFRQESAWQLLVELFSSGESGSEHQAMEKVLGAVHRLGLQAARVERIQETVLEALRVAGKRGDQDHCGLPVILRIWISSASTGDPCSPRERRGWGVFLIQNQGNDPQASAAEARHMIELYLYQERHS